MPIYEYRCKACGHRFEDFRSAAEADEQEACPKCGRPKTERMMSTFATSGASKSAGGTCGPSSGGFT